MLKVFMMSTNDVPGYRGDRKGKANSVMNFRQVEAFRTVLITGSVTKTAKAMNVTQPAVSRLLKDFGKETGLLLFERDGTGLKPTQEARQLFEEVNRAFVGLDSIMQAALQIRHKETADLSIAAISTISINVLPELVQRILRRFGNHPIAINTLTTPEVISEVKQDMAGLGIVELPVSIDGLSVERLPPIRPLVLLPKGHRLSKKQIVTAADFHNENYVALPSHLLHRAKIDRIFADQNVEPRLVAEARSTFVAARLVSLGVGIAILDPFVAKTLRSEVDLRPVDFDIQYEYIIVYKYNRTLSKRERYVCDYLHDKFTEFSQTDLE
ncbi:LysR substrate-binding domain-containing protein [Mesorhizobium sp. 1B3]|uniref:LysR substrate-binding domain-containing protein n=1 Tax=Mesorhizobium sp. 1B3 TaxID=3243599 RepID=UPI003D96C7D5